MSEAVGNYVRLTRVIRAPRQKVYDAWVDPKVRKLWWCASPEMKPGICEIDARVGGSFRVCMIEPGGKGNAAVSEFLELDPPNKLKFTWTWEGNEQFGGDTVITIELFDAMFNDEPATELLLTHERLNTPLERSDHTWGWLGCLRSLGKLFADQANARQKTRPGLDKYRTLT